MTTKEEYKVAWVWPWVEVEGASIGRGGGTGVVKSGMSLCWVLLSLSDCSFTVLWLSLAFLTHLFSLFQSLELLRWASILWEEAQQLKAEGLEKVQLAVAGSEADGV